MCICGNFPPYEECCAPLHTKKKQANTPEELMRSRYSAYVRLDAHYLLDTTLKENQYEEDIALIKDFSANITWLKLSVLSAEDNIVEFKAYYKDAEGIKVLHEKSNFVTENGVWKYKDGTLYNSKIERNEVCPCGSGKKYKKCCAI